MGVYVVHFSILVIIVGALIGSNFGHSGGINIPETYDTDKIFEFKTGTPIPLGFTVRCDWFTMTRYHTGAPKEYQSELVISENGKEMARKVIEVNHPMSYKGWTFYQSSFEPHKKILINVTNNQTGSQERFLTTAREAVRWPAENLLFGIQEVLPTEIPMTYRYRLLVSDETKGQQTLLIDDNGKELFKQGDGTDYTFHVKEFFSTGLQVSKDPGVWVVYLGCTLMLIGLYIAFFMSHQRIWLIISGKNIMVSGSSNKNKQGFSTTFNNITEKISNQQNIEAR